jgi:hypothetical protein
MTMQPCRKGSSELEVTRHYLSACVDADLRRTVSAQTQMDDVEDAWAFAVRHSRLDSARAIDPATPGIDAFAERLRAAAGTAQH